MKRLFYSTLLGLSALAFSTGVMAEDQVHYDNVPAPAAQPQAQTDSGIVLSQASVSDMQRALKSEGYSVSVDGVWGPTTAKAISEFQQANELPVTGEPDNQTLAALNIEMKPNR